MMIPTINTPENTVIAGLLPNQSLKYLPMSAPINVCATQVTDMTKNAQSLTKSAQTDNPVRIAAARQNAPRSTTWKRSTLPS
jgi:hypothetical protein